MPWIALIGLVVFAALAFGWRSWVQWRRTGSTGFRGFSGERGSLGRLLFVAAVVAAPLGPLLELGGVVGRIAWLDGSAARIAGFVLYAAGLLGTLWSQMAMGDSWRIGVDPGERTALVTRGPYRSVRNPIFTFMVLAIAGLALLAPNVVSVAAVLLLVAGVEIQVRSVEEPYLERTHGDEYRRYRARTWRFVPGFGR